MKAKLKRSLAIGVFIKLLDIDFVILINTVFVLVGLIHVRVKHIAEIAFAAGVKSAKDDTGKEYFFHGFGLMGYEVR